MPRTPAVASPTESTRHAELHDLAADLRGAVLQLARRLRLQDQGDMGPTSTSTLATIKRAGPLTISELAASEHVSVPTMSTVVSKLEERELVQRLRDPSDGRICRVAITEVGAAHLEANRARRTEWLEQRLEDVSAPTLAELREVIELLQALAGPLEAPR